MTIALLCPNNHKLFCPESMVGKRGKCPHCGATFRVPDAVPGGSNAGSGVGSASGSSPTVTAARPLTLNQGGSSPSKLGSLVVEEPPAEVPHLAPHTEPAPNPIHAFEDGQETGPNDLLFLCPQGHQLYGPPTIGGNEGECPVCGTGFLVPTAEELSEPEPHDEEPAGLDRLMMHFDDSADDVAESGPAPSLGELFDSLWAYRAQGATLELHLGDGKIFIPDGYAPQLSQRGQGVFMRREANGSYTLTAIAWESISHVAVKGIRNLPEGLFDLPG